LAGADLGLSTTIVAVTRFAFLREQVAARRDLGGVLGQRVGARFIGRGNASMQEPRRNLGLDRPRLGAGARQSRHEPFVEAADGQDDD
jgi:hypothetical protein